MSFNPPFRGGLSGSPLHSILPLWYKHCVIVVTEDVLVDDRGYMYIDTFMDGMYIVRCTI